MTLRQKERAKTLINDLSNGVLVRFVYNFPLIHDKNSPVIAHGREFTDFLASGIKKVYVPPLEIFDQTQCSLLNNREKFAPLWILTHLSQQCCVIDALEHVHMATARNVGYSVVACGHIRLNHTPGVVAAILADFPIGKIHRVLDDLPVVDRAASETMH